MKKVGKIKEILGSCDGEFVPQSAALDLHAFATVDDLGLQRAVAAFNSWKSEKPRSIIGVNFGFVERSRSISAGKDFVIRVLYEEEEE